MARMDRHCQIVRESLTGDRPVDEQTGTSMAILGDRLERLKQSSPLFAGVMFSPYAMRVKRRADAMVVS